MSLNLTQLHAKTVETSCLLSLWQNLKAPHSGVEYMANNNIDSHLIPLVGLSYALAWATCKGTICYFSETHVPQGQLLFTLFIRLYFCALEIMEIFNKCLPSTYFTHNHLWGHFIFLTLWWNTSCVNHILCWRDSSNLNQVVYNIRPATLMDCSPMLTLCYSCTDPPGAVLVLGLPTKIEASVYLVGNTTTASIALSLVATCRTISTPCM